MKIGILTLSLHTNYGVLCPKYKRTDALFPTCKATASAQKEQQTVSSKVPKNRVTPEIEGGADSLQSQVIDWLRFPLAVGIVFIHSFGAPPIDDMTALHADPLSAVNLYNWLRICLSSVLPRIAVPTFFLISGYLFFRHWQQWDGKLCLTKMKTRFRTLVVPYLCWNALAILPNVARRLMDFLLGGKPFSNILLFFEENGWLRMFWNCNVWKAGTNWLGMPMLESGPVDAPLWFLRDLIVVTALTPLFYLLLKHTATMAWLLLGLAYVSGIWPVIPGLTINAVFFFGLGAYFSIQGKNVVTECRRVRWLSYLLALLLLLLTIWFGGYRTLMGQHLLPFYTIAGVCAAFNLAADLLEQKRTRVIPLLSHSTFFIYAIHNILGLRHVSAFLLRPLTGIDHPMVQTVVYLLRPLLCVCICIGIFLFLQRLFPRVLGILTGNRY